MQISLRGKTIGGVAFIEAALLLVLIFTALSFLTRVVDDMLINRAKTTASLFSTTIKDAVLSYDLASLEAFAEELMSNPDLAYVRVFNQNDVVLAERGEALHLVDGFRIDTSLVEVKDGIFDIAAQIKQDEFVYGRVELGISIQNTQKAIAKVQQWSVSIAIVELLLVGLFSYLLGNYLTRQLSLLRLGSRRVREALKTGNFDDANVPVKGNDELADLAVSFNKLVDSLKKELALTAQQQRDLQDLNDSLEQKVQKRTQALSEKNTALLTANKTIKETQQQLLQAEKMASVGQLAAGVAHEINNPVGFVGSNLSTLKDYVATYQLIAMESAQLVSAEASALPEKISRMHTLLQQEDIDFINEDAQDLISESSEGLRRVSEIVAGLKMFSRVDTDEKQLFSINDCLRTTLNMVNNELKYVCDIDTKFAEIPQFSINVGKMSQVFTNILINAGHAIKSTGNFGKVSVSTSMEQEQVVIRITDTGPGIPESVKSKLFNPFFTTKQEGEGTGLGLSISIGIITDHGGEIDVHSEDGAGATFIIRLPLNPQIND